MGRELAADKIKVAEARAWLVEAGLNENSASGLVYNVRHLLRGECYKRAMSVAGTNDYLTWLRRDYGDGALETGLTALGLHIEYFENQSRVALPGLRLVLRQQSQQLRTGSLVFTSPEEIQPSTKHFEGASKTIEVNVYERSLKARDACIEEYGAICSVCEFDFTSRFGALGKGFIHVHHLRDLATIGNEYEVDPRTDLRPVCPNCHAMLHKRRPAYLITELRQHITDVGLMRSGMIIQTPFETGVARSADENSPT